ncbi:ParB N-terminal domain-containing protein [Alicyclobacillus suci]|uniref:ParB N-terminal domain-containing protein n=1 Tax=Alicyclobacillus suci TaxID=2816080 RepID=UPI001A8E5574|nr:ParB N-terminal domain-containing protein [Alicyclobacillus suci]
MRIETVKLENLIPAEYNPRIDLQPGDPEYEKLKRSIEEFGLVEPIVWNQRTGKVVGGHQRLKILQDLGVAETDVVIVDLDETREKALNLALNKIEGEIEKLMTDFSLSSEDEIRDDNFDADEALEDIVVPNTRRGVIWRFGRHLLLCGDATRREDVLRLMAGHKAQMVCTDPPYNVNYQGEAGSIKNDHMSEREFYECI